MMSSSRNSPAVEEIEMEGAADRPAEMDEDLEESDRDISASSEMALNAYAGRGTPPPVPPPPPPPDEGAPPQYPEKPPEYNEAVSLLQAHQIGIRPYFPGIEEVNTNPPPDYVELGDIRRRDSYQGAVTPTSIDVGGEREDDDNSTGAAEETSESAVPTPVPDVDVERGETRSERPCAPALAYLSRRRCLLIVMPMTLTCVVLFLAIFPVSFQYIHYHNIALKQSKWTGWVDFSRTYYAGCYVIGPEMEFIRFPYQAQHMSLDLSVTSSSALSYHINMAVVYRINATYLPNLYRNFASDYREPLKAIIGSTVKNKAVDIHMDSWFTNRRKQERDIEALVKERLTPYHIDVINVYLHDIVFPDILLKRMLKRVMESIYRDTAKYNLEQRVEAKKTDLMTADVRNKAYEVAANATAESKKIVVVAEAQALNDTSAATAKGLKGMYTKASFSKVDHVLSYYFLSSLNKLASSGSLLVASRNMTKTLRKTSGSFSETLAMAAASLVKPKV